MLERVTTNAALCALPAPTAHNNVFDPRMMKIITCRARWLIKTGLFPVHMKDDLIQELALILMAELDHFDREKGNIYTFARMVVCNRSKNMIERACSRKSKEPQEMLSLDVVVNEEQETLADEISSDDVDCILGKPTRPAHDAEDVAGLVREAICLLPEEHADICRAIMSGSSVSSLAKHHGLSRPWFRRKYFVPIRAVFVKVGLDHYLVEG